MFVQIYQSCRMACYAVLPLSLSNVLVVLTCLNVVQRRLNFRLNKANGICSKWRISDCVNVFQERGLLRDDYNALTGTSRYCKYNPARLSDFERSPSRTYEMSISGRLFTCTLTIRLCWFSDLHHAVSELWLLHHTADPSAYVSQAVRHVYVTCREKRQSWRTGTLNLLLI